MADSSSASSGTTPSANPLNAEDSVAGLEISIPETPAAIDGLPLPAEVQKVSSGAEGGSSQRRRSLQPSAAVVLAAIPDTPLEVENTPLPSPPRLSQRAKKAVVAYFERMGGVKGKHGPRGPKFYHWLFPPQVLAHPLEIFASFIGSFAGMVTLVALHYEALSQLELAMVIGSFAASAVLLFSVPAAPLAQPRNLVVGHTLSAIVGVTIRILIVQDACGGSSIPCLWSSAALAVSLAIVVMEFTGSVHPPGGATAFIAVLAEGKLQSEGYLFVLFPALIGALIMLVVALITNNLFPERCYPQYWW